MNYSSSGGDPARASWISTSLVLRRHTHTHTHANTAIPLALSCDRGDSYLVVEVGRQENTRHSGAGQGDTTGSCCRCCRGTQRTHGTCGGVKGNRHSGDRTVEWRVKSLMLALVVFRYLRLGTGTGTTSSSLHWSKKPELQTEFLQDKQQLDYTRNTGIDKT